MAAIKVENDIRFDTLETGALFAVDGSLIVRRQGVADRVTLLPLELLHGVDGTFTHNHPAGASFSVPDVLLAAEIGLKELRVVTRTARYVMTDIKGNVPDDLEQLYSQAVAHVAPSVVDEIKRGVVARADFTVEVTHRAWRWLASSQRFTYGKEQ